jgi:NADH:ubiquinone oxidoreductase subunit 2 (subunit N)
MEVDLNKRYQTMFTLWFALLLSVVMYFVFVQIAAPPPANPSENPPNSRLVVVITALGAVFVLASFVVKRKLLERSVEKQDVALVQKALVFACALCEVSALLGLLERFVFGNREYYLLFILAAAGDLFHFPRRSQLEAASHKSTNLWN